MLPPSDDMQTVSSYDLPCSDEALRHYPQEPWWWRERGAEDLRQEAYRQFDPFDISALTDEIRSRTVNIESSDSENATSPVRCLLSLSWKVDVDQCQLPTIQKSHPGHLVIVCLEIQSAEDLVDIYKFVLEQLHTLLANGFWFAVAACF